jgi:DNA repair exonuclease SbcCD ATPase subunit
VTDQELKEIRERLEAATPGPWQYEDYTFWSGGEKVLVPTWNAEINAKLADVLFIAHAPEDIRRLLNYIDTLKLALWHQSGEYAETEKRLLNEIERLRKENEMLRQKSGSEVTSWFGRQVKKFMRDVDEFDKEFEEMERQHKEFREEIHKEKEEKRKRFRERRERFEKHWKQFER